MRRRTLFPRAMATQRCIERDRQGGRWKRQVECRYYVELEGAEPERGMKLLPRETAEIFSLSLPFRHLPPLPTSSPFRDKGLGGVERVSSRSL